MPTPPTTRPPATRSLVSIPTAAPSAARAAIAVGLADVRRDADAAAELVTQARLWAPLRRLEMVPDWVRVRLPDYEGWVRAAELGTPGRHRTWAVVVTAPFAPVYEDATTDRTCEQSYIGTILPLATHQPPTSGQRIAVDLPNGRRGWVARDKVEVRRSDRPFPPRGPAAALELAHEFLGVPYLWGGTSPLGFDCSGLAQICYRLAGATIPRDADQQYAAIPYLVERGAVRPGDLIYFAARGAIDHVAIALGGERVIHASGSAGCVTINSLDRAAGDYSPRLAQMYAGARRPMPDLPDPPALDAQEAH